MRARKKPVSWLKRSSPTILICVSAIGVVATAILAAKAAPKAKKLLEEARQESKEELTKLEVVKIAAPVYIPAAISGAVTIACMFSANHLSRSTQAALSSAYAIVDQSFRRYQKKVKELFGEEAHNQVVGEILMEDVERQDVFVPGCIGESSSLNFGATNEPVRLFYDMFSHRAFNSTIERVLQAQYHFNRNYILGGVVSLNDFYEFLGLSAIDGGDEIGWTPESGIYWVDFNNTMTTLDDGLEYCVIDFTFDPEPFAIYNV